MDSMQQIESFTDELRRQEKAPNTIESYRYDLVLFSRWLEATNGEPFEAHRITPTDLREYRAYLLTVEQRSPCYDEPTAGFPPHLLPVGPSRRPVQRDPY